MILLAADEDFDNDIIRALRRRLPEVDVVRVQDAGLAGRGDPDVLEWAATTGRVLLTHDISTMTRHAIDREAAIDCALRNDALREEMSNELKEALLRDRLRDTIRSRPIAFSLLAPQFTISQTQAVYEAVLGRKMDVANFRKALLQMELLKEVERSGKCHMVGDAISIR